ncbi:3'-5' RNA exonuclease complex component [Marasmius sp. AFHP31]|nr:3'-5' RNA exonuclease complex component [Marasmius sp. AFHP31]
MYGRGTGTRSLSRTLTCRNLRHYHNGAQKEPRKLLREDKKSGTSTLRQMINDASKDRNTADKIATEALRMGGDFTLEKAAFVREREEGMDSVVSLDRNEVPTKIFAPGTFVEIRKPNTHLTGLILGTQFTARTIEYLTLTTSGAVWAHSKDDITFDVPQLVTPDLITRCGSSILPQSPTHHAARVEALKRLRGVDTTVQAASQRISLTPEALYSRLKSPNPKKASTVTAAEVARLLFKKPTMVEVYAAHRLVMGNPLYFGASYDYQLSQKFTVQPYERVELIKTVTAWTKQPDGPIKSFVEKARKIREYTAKLKKSGPPAASKAWWTWTPTDKTIIRFLLLKMRLQIGAQTDPAVIGTYYIVQKVVEDEVVDDAVMHKMLVDLGVIAPWGDLTPMAAEMWEEGQDRVEGDGGKGREGIVRESFERMKAMKTKNDSNVSLGPEDFYPSDPLSSLRHDFGDMPVYVLDDPGAKELDDGISIERVPNSSERDTFWVHIHIANPTSILPHTHILARDDGKLHDSLYLYYRNYPMLPRGLTHNDGDPCNSLSLHAHGKQNVLTFSAKVSLGSRAGDILDYMVRPGLVRNKIFSSYEGVNRTMAWPEPQYQYPFGCNIKAGVDVIPQLTQQDRERLGWLKKVADSAVKKRFQDGVFNHTTAKAELLNIEWPDESKPGIVSPDSYTLRPTLFTGFPRMSYRVSRSHLVDVGAHNVVAETMKLASRVASLFCRDRDVPILRRFAHPPVVLPTPEGRKAYEELLASRTPNGYVDYANSFRALAFDSAGGYSVDPKGHYGLGVKEGEGYVRVTSPLRRRADLVGHWQIQAALLNQAGFSREWMEDFAVQVATKTRLLTRVAGVHQAYYHVLFLKRFLESRRAKGHRMGPLTLHTYSYPTINQATKMYHVEGEIHSLGLKAILVDAPKHLEVGSSVEVELGDASEDAGIHPDLREATVLGLRPKVRVRPVRR